jgi:competence protein ComEC
MGGMPFVLANFHPPVLWVGNNPPVSAYRTLMADATDDGVRVQSFAAGQHFSFGETEIDILAPQPGYAPGAAPANDDSLVFRIGYGSTSALLEGDAQHESEAAMLLSPQAGELRANLLKVGHHGSISSTTPEFLAAVSPQFAVISVGRNNNFGHPRTEVVDRLHDSGAFVYRTDRMGARSFLLNGTTVTPAAP